MCFPWMGKCSKQHFGVPNVRLIAMVERSCKSRIIIQIDKSLSRAAVDNCVKQYHSDLLLRHQELCPWYNIHGSENLTNPLLLPRSQLLTDFESRWPDASFKDKDGEGCIIHEKGRNWHEKHYLLPLPTDQLKLNSNLKQNPGWNQ